ncbi:unnamed protein product [Paramecium sonneborni]|uniref:DNA/RNA-binding protein Alba-like domain-containing protein n=1 Tax=Paramecium sonneborni TaxID=65129 RepID=A0A8S1NQT0_9CILI|nr:unnamed protein product [Paramecium sonneborni]
MDTYYNVYQRIIISKFVQYQSKLWIRYYQQIMEKREKFDIMIKTKSTQDQIASYLVKAVLGLRDRENKSESVRLFGSGSAIPNVILVAEIIRARYKGLSSIVTLENMERDKNENGQTIKIIIPAIRIKLTGKPTQEEQELAGYQAPGYVDDSKKVELFEYVMIYAKNLYFWSGKDRQRQNNNNNTSYKQPAQQIEKSDRGIQSKDDLPERGEMKIRGGANIQKKQDDFKRKPDQTEYDDKKDRDYREQQRNTNSIRPRPYNQSKQNISQKKDEEIRTKQGEIRSRGGSRK